MIQMKEWVLGVRRDCIEVGGEQALEAPDRVHCGRRIKTVSSEAGEAYRSWACGAFRTTLKILDCILRVMASLEGF